MQLVETQNEDQAEVPSELNDQSFRSCLLEAFCSKDLPVLRSIFSFAFSKHEKGDSEYLFHALIVVWEFADNALSRDFFENAAYMLFPRPTLSTLPVIDSRQRDVWALLAACLCNLGYTVFRRALADSFMDIHHPDNSRLSSALSILRSHPRQTVLTPGQKEGD